MAFIDFFLHLDKHLGQIIAQYGTWTYAILFAIVFCETGLVVTPLLPGDSLLFAVGAFCATGSLRLEIAVPLLIAAAVLGDAVNYAVGHYLGDRLLKSHARLFKPEYLERTHRFYEKYGAKTIILARFVPIVRTFAPFVAGLGTMSYRKFALYNVTGGVAWICIFGVGGYWFGNIPVVKKNFTLVILAIILLSVLPGVVEFWKARREARTLAPDGPAA